MRARFCLFIMLIIGQAQAGDLYSIILGDTNAYNISDSIVNDLSHMRNEVSRIQTYTQLPHIEAEFDGSMLYPEDIFNYIEALQFNPDDVVIFFFSGHGYRSPSKEGNPWPNLYFSIVDQGVDFFYITGLLKEKNPGLLISICDCCNNSLSDASAPDVVQKELISEAIDSRMGKNYQKLFLETSGVIMIRSSDVGEYSWCNARGALFTNALLETMQNYIRNSKDVSWEKILNSASSKVLKYQKPIYELAIDTQ